MTDEEIAKYAVITVEEAQRLDDKHKAAIEAMYNFERDWNLYQAGMGPRPTNAIICEEKRGHRHD